MSLRLTGWQRVGIVLSVVWAIGGAFWGNQIGLSQGDWTVAAYRVCLDTRGDDAACSTEFHRAFTAAVSDHWTVAIIVGLAPIPLGWLAVYTLVGVGRWVKRGFKKPSALL
jgi:hypothetical protein